MTFLPLVALKSEEGNTPEFKGTLCDPAQALRKRWLEASGTSTFKPWANLRGNDKKNMFHDEAVALMDSDIVVRSAYQLLPAHFLMDARKYSIEHIVPRSKINGPHPGAAEDDPRGWWIAERNTNSRRGNLPLALWPDPSDGPFPTREVHEVDGVNHFFPPMEHRPLLARIWLFVRFNYRCIDHFDPPSSAQLQHMNEICAIAKQSISAQERAMNNKLFTKFNVKNPLIDPLIEDKKSEWLDDPNFRYQCFHPHEVRVGKRRA